MTEMSCEQARELLSSHLEGSLREPDSSALSAHVGRCPACAAEADGLKETIALLRGLPPRKAPPELMGRIAAAVASENRRPSLWRTLFLPVHVKIPLEAAAAAILFFLVFGLPGGTPQKERSADMASRPAAVEPAAPVAAEPAAKAPPAARTAAAGSRKRREPEKALPAPPEASPARELAADAGREARLAARPAAPPEGLPPATFASTAGKRVELAVGGPEQPVAGAAAPRAFAAPPSRMGHPLPYGREVVLEIPRAEGPAVEGRIAGAAVRLGGAHRRDAGKPGDPQSPAPAAPPFVRVDLPASATEEFLRELAAIGTIPPDGFPGQPDLPAGPAPDVVAFTVRIRVR